MHVYHHIVPFQGKQCIVQRRKNSILFQVASTFAFFILFPRLIYPLFLGLVLAAVILLSILFFFNFF